MRFGNPPLEVPDSTWATLINDRYSSRCVILVPSTEWVLVLNNAREPQAWLRPDAPLATALARSVPPRIIPERPRAPALDLDLDIEL